MFKNLFILLLLSSVLCLAQDQSSEYNLSVPEFIPANTPFEISLITSNIQRDADLLELYVLLSEKLTLLRAELKAPGISKNLPVARNAYETNGYDIDINLKENNLLSGVFFQVILSVKPDNPVNAKASLKGVFIKDDQAAGFVGTERDEMISSDINFYKPNRLAGRSAELKKGGYLQISNTHRSKNLLTEFWLKLNSHDIPFLEISSGGKTEFEVRSGTSGILRIDSENRLFETSPVFLSSRTWNHFAVLFSEDEQKAEFFCNSRKIASFRLNSSAAGLTFRFANSSGSPLAIDLFRFIDPSDNNEFIFNNRNYLSFISDELKLLEQVDFDDASDLRGRKDHILFVPYETSRSDAPVMPRAPELNINIMTHNYSLEWSGGDYKHAERYVLEKSFGSGYFRVTEQTADNNIEKTYSHLDNKNNQHEIIFYRIKQENRDGSVVYSSEVKIGQGRFEPFIIEQNFPNPFNPKTSIEFELLIDTEVEIIVYNLEGSEISRLFKGMLNSGVHKFSFDGEGLPSGIYLYKISTPEYTQTRKMILAK